MRLTKIVATLNSSNVDDKLLQELCNTKFDILRINTAHANINDTKNLIEKIRKISKYIAIMIDTKGPNLRSSVKNDFTVKAADIVKIISGTAQNDREIGINQVDFAKQINVGMQIIMDDGSVELEVVEVNQDCVFAKIKFDTTVHNHKSVNVPGACFDSPALTEKDCQFLEFAVKEDIEYIAHSFVRSAQDILAVREKLQDKKDKIKIIAKIENKQGLDNIDEIFSVADGVMVARGDLGLELPLEDIPHIQKNLIHLGMKYSKSVITATQMLQSMETSARPTRAEVSDVANAVYDGSDALMLSGETANGKYPLKAIETMAKIISSAESSPRECFTYNNYNNNKNLGKHSTEQFLIKTITESETLNLKAIICVSSSGRAARKISSFRAHIPIFVVCHDDFVASQLSLCFGVTPIVLPRIKHVTQLAQTAAQKLLEMNLLKKSDKVAFIGKSLRSVATNNLLCIESVDELIREN